MMEDPIQNSLLQTQAFSTQENVAVVKARLQEEGREARNLIAYSLPMESRKNSSATASIADKHPIKVTHSKEKKISAEATRIKQGKRQRSASAGRDPQASLRARHWGFLFRNLQQAVDEIYQTAEDDESIIECKEAILMLERYTNDFYKLIDWFKIKWEYEHTSPPQRPTSLTWEIRTSSPGKFLKTDRRNISICEARRALNFNYISIPVSSKKRGEVANPCDILNEVGSTPVMIINGNEKLTNCVNSGSGLRKVSNKKCELNYSVERKFTEPLKAFAVATLSAINDGIGDKVSAKSELYCISESEIAEEINKCETEADLQQSTDCTTVSSISDLSINVASQITTKDTSVDTATQISLNANAIDIPMSQASHSQIGHSDLYASKLKDSTNDKSALTKIMIIHSNDDKSDIQNQSKELNKCSVTEDSKNKAGDCAKYSEEDSKPKDHNKIIVKEENKSHSEKKEEKNYKEENKSHSENLPKQLHPKPGPQVNMNKASQVRKAFNQSKTPVKYSQGSFWKQTYSLSENRVNCTKHQGSGSRLTVRRLVEGKQTQCPPLNRRISGQRVGPFSTPNRSMLERSSTSYPINRTLVRSSTTLESSCLKSNNRKFEQANDRSLLSDGKCPSNISLASSSNTSSSGLSWADKVKGNSVEKSSTSEVSLQDNDDDEGWEVVRRHKRSHGGSAASLNSQKLYSGHKNYSELQKKGSVPLHMKSRFHHPSSAVSLPSLHATSDIDEVKRDSSRDKPSREVVPNGDISSQKCNFAKGNKQAIKKVNLKRKRINKDNTSSSSSGSMSSETSTKCSRICKDAGVMTNSSFTHSTKTKVTSSIDKDKKDAANAKMQYESNISTKSQCEEESNAVDDKLPFNDKQISEKSYSDVKVCDGVKEVPILGNHITDVKCISTSTTDAFKQPQKATKQYESNHSRIAEDSASLIERESDSESEREEEKMRCNEEAFECAVERERELKQQIEETKRTPIEVCDVDDEDVVDVDNEIEGIEVNGGDVDTETNAKSNVSSEGECFFYQYDPSFPKLGSLSWADEMDVIEQMEELRPPGRVLHIHEKLSSPSRKLTISEKLRRHKEKLAKAHELRGKLIMTKTEKLKDLFRKIDEVIIDKDRLLSEKRDLFDRKMVRAEEKRRCHLQEIVNKAHDEENKAKEIAFINGLEAQNKLHDIMQQHQSHESRLADMAEERSRKQEEKAAKEVAAQERRKALEAERKARMLELCEKRRKRCERIDRQQAERREELLEQAREKARDREERRSALQQAQQAKESELVKKIQQKQEETARRHEENIEQIRQKALESSIMKYSRGCDEAPKLRNYEIKKLCTLCNSVITSEVYLLSHLRGLQHQEALKDLHKKDVSLEESETYNLKFIIDAPANIVDTQVTKDKERQKSLRKRCRKIRIRMTSRGKEFLKEYATPTCKETPLKSRMAKSLTQIGKLLSNQGSGPWLTADVTLLDRHLLELHRMLEKSEKEEQKTFSSLDGFRRLFNLLNLISSCNDDDDEESQCVVPSRSLAYCSRVLSSAAKGSKENCRFLLFSNLIGNIVDYLIRRLNDMAADFTRSGSSNSLNTITSLPSDPAAASLMDLLAQVLQDVSNIEDADVGSEKTNESWPRLQDVVSFCVSMGVTDKISWYFSHVQNPVENDPSSAEIILSAMSLLSALSGKLCGRAQPNDPTQLIGTFHVLDACGVVSLLYGLLLHQGGRSPSPPSSSLLSPSTLAISAAATTLLHYLAELNLKMFQSILGSEGISLEFRHIASFLLWYCSHWPCEEILHNVIALVGFFAVGNKENQSIIQSGETPSVLQQLCSLPWQYFSEPRLTAVLFPTLLACCLNNEDNLVILQQEMSFQILEDYFENNKSSKKPLMMILPSLNVNK